MDLLPHSNGVRKVNMKRKKTTKEILKEVTTLIVVVLIIGFVIQQISNFIANETLIERVDYTTVDDKRMDYKLEGTGKYTVVFDGVLGGNLEVWNAITTDLQENDNVSTFVYNRRGYGFSASGSRRTIDEQAQDLKILLRKSGASEPYILVGEEYGSLVLTSFAKQFPNSVAGIVLINAINADTIGKDESSFKNIIMRLRRKIEQLGSNVGLTMLLDKLNMDINMDDIEKNFTGETLDEFLTQRTKSSYTTAVCNELSNLSKGENTFQNPGVFSGKPYYLITKDNSDVLRNLGDENLTTVQVKNTDSKVLSLTDSQDILVGIRQIIKQCND